MSNEKIHPILEAFGGLMTRIEMIPASSEQTSASLAGSNFSVSLKQFVAESDQLRNRIKSLEGSCQDCPTFVQQAANIELLSNIAQAVQGIKSVRPLSAKVALEDAVRAYCEHVEALPTKDCDHPNPAKFFDGEYCFICGQKLPDQRSQCSTCTSDEICCGAKKTITLTCTRSEGHEGKHVACTVRGHEVAAWPHCDHPVHRNPGLDAPCPECGAAPWTESEQGANEPLLNYARGQPPLAATLKAARELDGPEQDELIKILRSQVEAYKDYHRRVVDWIFRCPTSVCVPGLIREGDPKMFELFDVKIAPDSDENKNP